MEDQGHPDHKILGVPLGDPLWRDAGKLEDVPSHVLRELEHFFTVYKELEEKKTAALGWQSREEAEGVIESAFEAARHN